MLYLLIIVGLIFVFIVIWFLFNISQKKKSKLRNVEINFQDVDSLNVSKIVIEENDIDYLRNELWFKYKQKQIINIACFHILKKNFEKQTKIEISNWIPTHNKNEIDTFKLIEIIISDAYSKEEIANAFYLLEQRIK